MAGAYAQEFEKWLQVSNTAPVEDEDSVDVDDLNDKVDNCQSKNILRAQNELAPDLCCDRNGSGLNSGSLQDEPPILEPVRYGSTKVSDDVAFSSDYNKESESTDCYASQNESEKSKIETFKTNLKNVQSEKCYDGKLEKSENIFDKFSLLSEADDFPPPLIPSHEAHLTTVDAKDEDSPTEKSYATLQNLSPNFCAMEADSTTEMMKADQNDRKERQGKAPVSNDIGMECDSTCMLSVSPHVISPQSNFDSDNPNTPFNPDMSAGENPQMSWNSFPSRETYTSLMPFSEHTHHTDYRNNFLAADGVNSVGVYRRDSGEWDRECPKLEAVQDVRESNSAVAPLHNNVGVEDPHEPPVLSVVPPPSLLSPRMAARRKRHTIDTVESVSRKHKSYSKDFSSNRSQHIGPASSKSNHSSQVNKNHGRTFSASKRRDSTHSANQPRPRKYRERCKTIHIVDLISYSSHLPKDLFDFVVNSSQLSILQNRMHRLVFLLFPQLAPELESMSPESLQFETLLKDLIYYLKEPSIKQSTHCESSDSAGCSSDGLNASDSENYVKPYSKVTNVCNINSTRTSIEDTDSVFGVSPKQDLNEGNLCSRVIDDGPCCSKDLSQHSNSSVFSNSSHPTHNTQSNTNSRAIGGISLIPGLSQLSLNKESERILKNQPSVLIHKNPSALHRNFCKLSCCTLQLLLPDLNVSLTREFSNSPKDLLHFIDSVIASNSHDVE